MNSELPAINPTTDIPGISINDQIRSASVPPLTFHEVGDCGEILRDSNKEAIRQLIWDLWNDQHLDIKAIAGKVGLRQYVVRSQLALCQSRFDEWIQTHGLLVHGTDKARLLVHIQKLESVLGEIEADILNAEGDKGKAAHRKLQLQVMAELAKYKGIVPAQEVNVTFTSAQETRETMKKLFPDTTEAQFRVIEEDKPDGADSS